MIPRSLLLRSYIILLMLSLATEVDMIPFKALTVKLLPLSFFFIMGGLIMPFFFLRDFLRFLREKQDLLILAGLFLLSGFISVLLSPFSFLYGAKWLFNYGLFFGVSFLLLFLVSLERGLGLFFLKTLAALSVLYALIAMIEVIDKDLLRFLADTFRSREKNFAHGWVRPAGTLQHPNIFGCFMSIGVLIFIYLKEQFVVKRHIFVPAVLTLCFALLLSASRNALLVLLIPLSVLFFNKKTAQTALLIFLAICLLGAVTPPFQSKPIPLWNIRIHNEKATTGKSAAAKPDSTKTKASFNTVAARLMLWESGIRIFKDHPIFGIGPGGYNKALKDYASPSHLAVEKKKIDREYLNAHNGLLNLLAEFGIAGTLLAMLSLLCLLKKIGQRYGPVLSSPVYPLVLAILISFGPDAFFYSRFYMVLSLFLLFFFAFHKEDLFDVSSTSTKKAFFYACGE